MLAFCAGKAFNCLVDLKRTFLSPTTALALQYLNEWVLGSTVQESQQSCVRQQLNICPSVGHFTYVPLGKRKESAIRRW